MNPEISELEAEAEWFGPASVALQLDGHDVVHVTDMDSDGYAWVRVYNLHPDSPIVWEGPISLALPEPKEE